MLSKIYLTELGRVIASFSELEHKTKFLFARTLFPKLTQTNEDVAYSMVAKTNFTEILDSIKYIAKIKIKDKQEIEALLRYLNKSKQINSKRNDLIHGYWRSDKKKNKKIFSVIRLERDKTKLKNEIEKFNGGMIKHFSINDLKRLNDEIIEQTFALYLPYSFVKIEEFFKKQVKKTIYKD